MEVRSIDHYVLVAGSLSLARERYRKLGFTVAPDGVHPFGTYNANMYFRDGPMIETLAVENPATYSRAAGEGNTFVKNDAMFRMAKGDYGFSHIVVTSTDADADHGRFVTNGVSGGDIVAFSRDFERPDGTLDTVSARLSFATHPAGPSAFYFSCQDIVVPAVDRTSLLDHENGVLGAKHAYSTAPDPAVFEGFLKGLVDPNAVRMTRGAVDCLFPNGRTSIVPCEFLAREFGVAESGDDRELGHRGLVFETGDLSAVEALFTRNSIEFVRMNGRLVTHPHPESGLFFAFEQRG